VPVLPTVATDDDDDQVPPVPPLVQVEVLPVQIDEEPPESAFIVSNFVVKHAPPVYVILTVPVVAPAGTDTYPSKLPTIALVTLLLLHVPPS
jgi:hypothetical protein